MQAPKVNKHASKGVRLGWPHLSEAPSVKLTQLNIKGVNVTPGKSNDKTEDSSKKNYLIP